MKRALFYGIAFLQGLGAFGQIGLAEGVANHFSGSRVDAIASGSHPKSTGPIKVGPGFQVMSRTECRATDGTVYVNLNGRWLIKKNSPDGKSYYVRTDGQIAKDADPRQFAMLIGTSVSVEPRTPIVSPMPSGCWLGNTFYAHGQTVPMQNGELWQCNNGQFYVVGRWAQPTYDNGSGSAEEERRNDAGVGGDGTIGRGSDN